MSRSCSIPSHRSPTLTAAALRTLAGLAVATCVAFAQADEHTWTNPLGGSAGTGSNWNPAQAPIATDTIRFTLANTYTVTLPATMPTLAGASFGQGIVTLSPTSGARTFTGDVTIGSLQNINPPTLVLDGTFNIGGSINLGSGLGGLDQKLRLRGTTTLTNATERFYGFRGTLDVRPTDSVSSILTCAGGFDLGVAFSSNATAMVGFNTGVVFPAAQSRISIGGDARIGIISSGSLQVTGGGEFLASQRLSVGAPFAAGEVTVGGTYGSRGALLTAANLDLGVYEDSPFVGSSVVSSMLVSNGGTVRVAGQTRIGLSEVAPGNTNDCRLTVDGGLFETNSLAVRSLGANVRLRDGTLRLTPGGSSTLPGVALVDGSNATDDPEFHFDGCTALIANGFAVGNFRSGRMRVSGGAQVTSDLSGGGGGQFVGNAAGSVGQLIVQGAGSTLTLATTVPLVIGDEGHGILTVTSGAHVLGSSVQLAPTLGGTADATISGLNSVLDSDSLSVGQFAAPFESSILRIQNGGEAVTGPCRIARLSTLLVDAAALRAVNTLNRRIEVFGTLQLSNAATVTTDDLTIALGGLTTGTGSITADIHNLGSLTATGPGLQISGTLSSMDRPIAGTSLRFLSGGGFVGRGTIGPSVLSEPGTTFSVFGGDLSFAAEVNLGGDLFVNGRTVTLSQPGIAQFGGLTDLAQGAIVAPGTTVSITATGTLTGGGAVAGNVQYAGTIDPNRPIGTMGITGSCSAASSDATLRIDFRTPDLHDELNIGGFARLAGRLELVTDNPAVFSGPAFSTVVLTANGGIIGAFDTLITPPNIKGSVKVIYTPTQAIVSYCAADFNSDGELDPDDLADFIGCFFAQPPCASADTNADGIIDPDDLADFIGAFFNGCS